MACGCGVFLFGLVFILPSSLSSTRNRGIKAEDQWLSQPQWSVSVVVGDVLHLECRVANILPPGPVKWFLGEEPQRKLIYADVQRDKKDERVTRNSPGSNTDFTISICNVTLEDEGTYYCVKQKRDWRRNVDWLLGPGTRVVVKATLDNPDLATLDNPDLASRKNLTIPIAIGVSGFILACLLCVALYVYLKRKKGLRNNQTRSDFIFPEKQQLSMPFQTSGNKEIVYADLKDHRGLQTPRKIDTEVHSEYATIKGAPSRAADKGTFHSLEL